MGAKSCIWRAKMCRNAQKVALGAQECAREGVFVTLGAHRKYKTTLTTKTRRGTKFNCKSKNFLDTDLH